MPSPGRQLNCLRATRCGLNDLGVNGILVSVVGDVDLDGRAGAVAVEHVVDATFGVDDQRDLDHDQAEFFTKIVFDVTAQVEKCFLRFLRS